MKPGEHKCIDMFDRYYCINSTIYSPRFTKSMALNFVQGSHRPGKVLEFDVGPGKLQKFEKSIYCPGIVLEFCKTILENMNLSLKNLKYNESFQI